MTTLHVLDAYTGEFLGGLERRFGSEYELYTPDDSTYFNAGSIEEAHDEACFFLGIGHDECYITDEDETKIVYA